MKLIFYLLIYISTLFNLYGNNILHIKIDGAISPATSKYFNESLSKAKEINAHIMLVELNTPGGLVTTTREIVQKILNSKIPIVMYVSPKGSRAASAGTFLMYASHIAAMAPSTNIGAATPVSLGGGSNPMSPQKEKKEDKTKEVQDALEKKIINDTIAYIKSIAEHKNRNVQWAIEAVKKGKSISSNEALSIKVIDYVANDINDLLKKINNKSIKVNNKKLKINTNNSSTIIFEASWKTKILMSISNPNIAYIFLILAFYGILFEMMNPGSFFPGVIGAISALIAFYSLNILPFNYVGLLLIILGIALMIAEITIAGIGVLGISGLISFSLGSFLLFDEKTLGIAISYPLIFAISIVSLSFFTYLLSFLFKFRKEKSAVGIENLVGKEASIVCSNNKSLKVEYNGELWDIRTDEKLNINDKVLIEKIDGLILEVRSIK